MSNFGERIAAIEQSVRHLEDSQDAMRGDIAAIKAAVIGDGVREGLSGRVRSLERACKLIVTALALMFSAMILPLDQAVALALRMVR